VLVEVPVEVSLEEVSLEADVEGVGAETTGEAFGAEYSESELESEVSASELEVSESEVEDPPLPASVLSQSMVVLPLPTTVGPGFLNLMASTPSGTVHPLPELARNMVGRASKPAFDVSDPPIVTVAHFMYISRLPLLLNQVLHQVRKLSLINGDVMETYQATTALPAGRPSGTLNEIGSRR
jgi:hypothetical protein